MHCYSHGQFPLSLLVFSLCFSPTSCFQCSRVCLSVCLCHVCLCALLWLWFPSWPGSVWTPCSNPLITQPGLHPCLSSAYHPAVYKPRLSTHPPSDCCLTAVVATLQAQLLAFCICLTSVLLQHSPCFSASPFAAHQTASQPASHSLLAALPHSTPLTPASLFHLS